MLNLTNKKGKFVSNSRETAFYYNIQQVCIRAVLHFMLKSIFSIYFLLID